MLAESPLCALTGEQSTWRRFLCPADAKDLWLLPRFLKRPKGNLIGRKEEPCKCRPSRGTWTPTVFLTGGEPAHGGRRLLDRRKLPNRDCEDPAESRWWFPFWKVELEWTHSFSSNSELHEEIPRLFGDNKNRKQAQRREVVYFDERILLNELLNLGANCKECLEIFWGSGDFPKNPWKIDVKGNLKPVGNNWNDKVVMSDRLPLRHKQT